LAVTTDKGLVVVSGCAHSGICNIIEQARKVTGVGTVYGVVGGFHLKHADDRLASTIDFLKQLEVKIVMPSHCTGIAAQCAFYQAFGGNEVKTGLQFDF
jgi:7,8-dihydropterin-6-yl-methyl-4-(beta-D-ribofuranosyl)aminobenzene 5'-phosphate synthase